MRKRPRRRRRRSSSDEVVRRPAARLERWLETTLAFVRRPRVISEVAEEQKVTPRVIYMFLKVAGRAGFKVVRAPGSKVWLDPQIGEGGAE